MVSPLNLPTPAAVGDEWGNALNSGVQAVNADVETLKGRLISAGTGLLGGGSLAANRSLSVDFAASGAASAGKAVEATDTRLSDARTPLAHAHAYDTLTGIPATFAPSAHTHAQADVTNLVADLAAKVPSARLVSTGSGLTGGGDLSANRTLAVDFATAAPLGLALAAAVGTAVKPAREDHVHPTPAWQAYTPSLGNATLGTGGALSGRYVQIGKTVVFYARVKFGTGLAINSSLSLSLPVQRVNLGGGDQQAHAIFLDSGTSTYMAFGYMNALNVVLYGVGANGAVTAVGPTAPFTWAANDEVWVNGTYEAA